MTGVHFWFLGLDLQGVSPGPPRSGVKRRSADCAKARFPGFRMQSAQQGAPLPASFGHGLLGQWPFGWLYLVEFVCL